MSSQTVELLNAFETLPEDDKRAFAAEVLRRALPFDSGPLEDDEIAHVSDQLFAFLDAEEQESENQ